MSKWYNWLNRRELILQKYRKWNIPLLWESIMYDASIPSNRSGNET